MVIRVAGYGPGRIFCRLFRLAVDLLFLHWWLATFLVNEKQTLDNFFWTKTLPAPRTSNLEQCLVTLPLCNWAALAIITSRTVSPVRLIENGVLCFLSHHFQQPNWGLG